MSLTLNNFDPQTFLESFWQQRHLLIQQALPDYQSPISPDDLAGLALEEVVESRLIGESHDNQWQMQAGPFDEAFFSNINAKNWTLLVQAVDFWLPDIEALKAYFKFIPDWRMDDIMISYAPTGGSVGPHFDQYDVFLLQASGQRQWKIGQHCDDNTALQDTDTLKLLAEFSTEAEYLVNAGDILYVPPGCAHWGVSASDDCMTISIGFRAPSFEDIILQHAEQIACKLPQSLLFSDAKMLNDYPHPAEISMAFIQQIKTTLSEQLLNDSSLADSFGQLVTQTKYPALFDIELPQGQELSKRPDSRLAYHQAADSLQIFANGQSFHSGLAQLSFVQHLSESNTLSLTENSFDKEQQAIVDWLISHGFYEDAVND